MRLRWMHVMMAAAAPGAARAFGCRVRGIVGAGLGGALRTCGAARVVAAWRGSVQIGL